MLFDRYKEVTGRCLELAGKMDTMTHEESNELCKLLEEQSWLSKTISRNAKSVLEEIRRDIKNVEKWVNEELARVEEAAGEKGGPAAVQALEEVINKADNIKKVIQDPRAKLDTRKQVNLDNIKILKKPGISMESAKIRIDLSGEDKSIQGEIEKGKKEAAASLQQGDEPSNNRPPEKNNAGSKKTREKSGGESSGSDFSGAVSDPVLSHTDPLTYKFSSDLLPGIEEKIYGETLISNENSHENNELRNKNNKKDSRKKSKKRKK